MAQVWHLIVLQGVLCGASGAVMYTAALVFLQQWFVVKRGTASGIM